jgi:hypothetical protein
MAKAGEPLYFCGACNEQIGPGDPICPSCKAQVTRRHIALLLQDSLTFHSQLRLEQRRPGIAKALMKIFRRSKTSGQTKRPADETLIVDRTGAKTKVTHKVQELDADGNWITVHEHDKTP